jgi:hypothetical protein
VLLIVGSPRNDGIRPGETEDIPDGELARPCRGETIEVDLLD